MKASDLRAKLFCSPGNDEPGEKVRHELRALADSGWQIPLEELAPDGEWQPVRSPMKAYAHNLVSVTLNEKSLNPGFLEFADVVARLARLDEPVKPLATCLVYVISDFAQKWDSWNHQASLLLVPMGQAPALVVAVADALQMSGGYTDAWANGMRSAFSRGPGCGAEASARLESVLVKHAMQERLGITPAAAGANSATPSNRTPRRLCAGI